MSLRRHKALAGAAFATTLLEMTLLATTLLEMTLLATTERRRGGREG